MTPGERITNLIRDSFVDGNLQMSLGWYKNIGLSMDRWVDVCIGNMKIDDYNKLRVDNIDVHKGISLDINDIVVMFDKMLSKLFLELLNARNRLGYFEITERGIYAYSYNDDSVSISNFTYKKSMDLKIIEEYPSKIEKFSEILFNNIYPRINRNKLDYDMWDYINKDDLFKEPYSKNVQKNLNIKNITDVSIDTNIILDPKQNFKKILDNVKSKMVEDNLDIKKRGLLIGEGRTKEWMDWIKKNPIDTYDYKLNKVIPNSVGKDASYMQDGQVWVGRRTPILSEVIFERSNRRKKDSVVYYYGKLTGGNYKWVNINDENLILSICDLPNIGFNENVNIIITKQLTEDDIINYPSKKVGDIVEYFIDEKELSNKIKSVYQQYFKPGGWYFIN